MKIKAEVWQEDAVWCASAPALKGCHTWGKTYDEMIKILKYAVQGWLEVAGERDDLEPNHKIVELAL
jgi:predicted RNase H-like HicB family nuclease